MICGSGGSTSRLAKAADAEPAGQMRDEKLHAVVARSTFRSQNVQSSFGAPLKVEMSKKCTPLCRPARFQVKMYKAHAGSEHFLKLTCRKSARRCGAKHISKSTCKKHTRFGPLLEVEMSKKCTQSWREAHLEVKMHKAHHVRTTFGSWDVEKVRAVGARSPFRSQNVQSTTCSDHFLTFRCRFAWQAQGIVHLVKSEQNVRVLWPRAVQETCLAEMLGGPGADFLRMVAFWSIRSSVLGRWFCVTSAALRMTCQLLSRTSVENDVAFHFHPPMFSLHPIWPSYAVWFEWLDPNTLTPPLDVSFILFRHLALRQSEGRWKN